MGRNPIPAKSVQNYLSNQMTLKNTQGYDMVGENYIHVENVQKYLPDQVA